MNKLLIVGIIATIALVAMGITSAAVQSQLQKGNDPVGGDRAIKLVKAAPIAISGGNTYIVWWTNVTGNDEIMFRASSDGGSTFGDKLNLSNSSGSDSQDAEIAADGDNIIITWWERNQTAEEPMARISDDNGVTFGPLLRLSTNGTVGEAAE